MLKIDLSRIPESAQIDLCASAILGTAKAMKTAEGRAAIEKGKQEYLDHLAQKKGPHSGLGQERDVYGQAYTQNVC